MGLLLFTRGIAATFNKIQKRMTINPIIIFSSAFIEFADYKTDITNLPLAKLPVSHQFKVQFDLDVARFYRAIIHRPLDTHVFDMESNELLITAYH